METKTKLNSKPKKTIMQVRKAVERRRFAIQAIFSLLTNSYVVGFLTGTIYKGPLKQICVPGMNCYSCPGALGACPIGSLQAIFNQSDFSKGVWSDSNGYLVTKPLYYFAFYARRRTLRKARLRFSLPVRTDSGSAAQDSAPQEA